MKNKIILFLTILCACPAAPASAAATRMPIDIGLLDIDVVEDSVKISFRITADRRAVRTGQYIVVAPKLIKERFTWSLPSIIVQGRLAEISRARHTVFSKRAAAPAALYLRGGDSRKYSVTLAYQRWMEGAELVMEAIKITPCLYGDPTEEIIAKDLTLLPVREKQPSGGTERTTAPEKENAPAETKSETDLRAEALAREYPYAALYNRQAFRELTDRHILYDEERLHVAAVYFAQDHRIAPDYQGNARTLSDLAHLFGQLREEGGLRLKAVVVAGFASPDGEFAVNDRLAWRRAAAVERYLTDSLGVPSESIHIYNGSEDWQGLRMLVEQSGHDWKQRVLDTMDSTPVADETGRKILLEKIKELDGGRPYRYLRDHYFPLLRSGGVLRVYFEKKEGPRE